MKQVTGLRRIRAPKSTAPVDPNSFVGGPTLGGPTPEELALLEAPSTDANGPSAEELAMLEAPDVEPTREEHGMLESGVRGAAQGATLGFSDEIAGLGKALFGAAKDVVTGEDTNKGGSFGDRYARERDEERKANKEAKEDNPWTYGLSEFGGGVASSFVPGLGLAKGAQAAKGALAAAKAGGIAGAKMGAVGGVGYSEGKNVGDIAKDAAYGGLVGGATGGLISGVVGGAPGRYVSRKIGDITDGATATMRDRVSGKGGENVDTVIDLIEKHKGIGKAGSNPEKALPAVDDALNATMDKINRTFAGAKEATDGISGRRVADTVEAIANKLDKDPGKADLARAVRSKVDDIRLRWDKEIPGSTPPRGATFSDKADQLDLPMPGAKEIKRIRQGEGGRFEKAPPKPGYPEVPRPSKGQQRELFGKVDDFFDRAGTAKVIEPKPNMVSAQQLRELAKDIGDSAFHGSPAVAPKAGKKVAQDVWKAIKELIDENIDEAAKKMGGTKAEELRRLNKEASTLMNMRQALQYRATRDASPTTRLKDRMFQGLDLALLYSNPSAFMAKKAVDYVGMPLARGMDAKLAKLVTMAQKGDTKAEIARRAIALGMAPVAAKGIATWLDKSAANIEGTQ